MRILLAVLSLLLAWEAAAEVHIKEVAESLCRSAPPELLPWLWNYFVGDLDGDGRVDLIVPNERDLGELPSRMRVLLQRDSDGRYRDIGRVPYADALVVEEFEGVRVISLLEELHPRALRAHQYEVRAGRLVFLGQKTIGVWYWSITPSFEGRGTIICDPTAPTPVRMYGPMDGFCGYGVSQEAMEKSAERERRIRKRVVELLRPKSLVPRP